MFTKQQIIALQAKLDATLKEFAEANGLVSGSSKVKYSQDDFTATISFSDKSANPNAVDPKYLIDLRRRGWDIGLTEAMLGRVITLNFTSGPTKVEFIGMCNSKVVLRTMEGRVGLYNAAAVASRIIAAA